MLSKLLKEKPKRQYLALDVGSQNTKIMIFAPDQALVKQAMVKPTPQEAFQGGAILNEESLSEFLTHCVADLKLKNEISVVTALSGKGVIVKKIDIPKMDKSMIQEFVEIEAEQELFYNNEEMTLDYDVLKGVNFKKPEDLSLIVVTALNKTIESWNRVIENSFMKCEILDTGFFALFNSFEKNEALEEKLNYMVLDIGHFSTNLLAVVKNQVVFVRNIPSGGDFFTQGIQKKMKIEYNEAEDLKLSLGQDTAPKEVAALIKNELNPAFVEELISCYELYHSLFPGRHLHRVFITGGASLTFNLLPCLKERLALPVEILNPFKNIALDKAIQPEGERLKSLSSVAVGLGLRGFS